MKNGTNGTIKRKQVPRWLKIVFFIFILLLIIVSGLLWYWKTHKKAIIRDKLVKTVSKNSDGLYKMEMGDLELDELAGWLSISNLHLTYDSSRYLAIRSKGDPPPMLVTMDIESLKITGIKSRAALLKSKIRGGRMEVNNPVIEIIYTNPQKNKKEVIPTKEEIYRQIISGIDIMLDSLLITHAQVFTRSLETGKLIVHMQDLGVTLVDLAVNEEGRKDSSRLFFSKEFRMSAAKINWPSENKMYRYSLLDVTMGSASRELEAEKFLVKPKLGEEAFVAALPAQDDRFDILLEGIRVTGLDPGALIDKNLRGQKMQIRSASFKDYRDLGRPRDHKNRVGYYPQQVINRIPFTFAIDKVVMSRAFIEYKERNNITRRPGKVQFYGANAVLSNFTNDSSRVAKNNVMTADFSSRFLNQANLQVHWVFYLMHPQGRFDVKGSAGAIGGDKLNQLIEPMGPAKIERGHLSSLQFDFKGNNYSINGTVKMLYEDLKVSILERDKGATETDKKFLTSLLANLIIKNDNPKGKKPPRIASVNYPRDTNRSLFNLCWKGLFKGMKETVGVKK